MNGQNGVALKLLHIEDDLNDFDLIQIRLKQGGFNFDVSRVDSEEGLRTALSSSRFDIVLSDLSLPRFDGVSAFELVRKADPGMPFIFLSGTIRDGTAVEQLVDEKTDCVRKDDPEQLAQAIRRLLPEIKSK
ncbi:MAG TPA: response regulator [Bacteroidota bacterium]|nr:response regulator [Bacteroidota bacterium]